MKHIQSPENQPCGGLSDGQDMLFGELINNRDQLPIAGLRAIALRFLAYSRYGHSQDSIGIKEVKNEHVIE